MSPSDDTAEDPSNKRSKFSYSREVILSLAKTESIELPKDVCLSISLAFEEGLLSPPFCDSDSRLDTSVPQLALLKVSNEINESLRRSNVPYRPPHRYKVWPEELYESSGFPSSTSLHKGEEKRWKHVSHEEKSYADKTPLSKEDKRHVNRDKDCDKSSEAFLLSPSSGNFTNLQSLSEATEQMIAPHKPCQIQETVKCNVLQRTILPRSAKSCSNEHQPLQDDFIDNPVNLSHRHVNHMDSYHNLSFLEEGFHLKESEACSNLNVGHPDRIPGVMEFHEKSRSPNFKKNLVEYGKGEKREVLDSYLKPFLSTVDKSAMVHCKGNFFFDGVDQAILLSKKRNSSTCDCHVLQDLDLNTFSMLEEKSNDNSDLCLPDEDGLIRFDEPFLKPDEQNWDAVHEFVSSPEKNPIKDEMHSPSSPGEMILKLVESILEDESSPDVYHNSGLSAQQSLAQFCHHQLSPGWDQQVHNTFRRNSIDSTSYSPLNHHYFQSNTISQPFHLFHDKMTIFYHTSPPMLGQMKNLDPPYVPSFRRSLGGVTRNLSMHMGSHTHY